MQVQRMHKHSSKLGAKLHLLTQHQFNRRSAQPMDKLINEFIGLIHAFVCYSWDFSIFCIFPKSNEIFSFGNYLNIIASQLL